MVKMVDKVKKHYNIIPNLLNEKQNIVQIKLEYVGATSTFMLNKRGSVGIKVTFRPVRATIVPVEKQ